MNNIRDGHQAVDERGVGEFLESKDNFLKIQKILDIIIGMLFVLLIVISVQLVCLYLSPDESLAQAPKTNAHPEINGQPLPDMPDKECLACHQNLP